MNYNKLVLDLKSRDEDLRIFACMSIFKSEEVSLDIGEKLFEILIELTQDKNICVRFYAKKALNRIKELLTANVRNTLEVDGDFFTINDVRDSDFLDLLNWFSEFVQTNTTDKSTSDIVNLIYKYAKYNQEEVTRHLLQILNITTNSYLKATIIKILGYKKDSDIVIALTPFLNDSDPRVKSNTIEAFERIHNPETIRLIIPKLSDTDNRVRATAAKVLSTFGEESVFGHLSDMLNSFELWMRESAVYALSQIKSPQSKFLLLRALSDSSEDIRLKVIESLSRYTDSDVRKALEVLTHSKGVKISSKAEEALKKIQVNTEKEKIHEEKIKKEKSMPFDFSVSTSVISEIDTQTVPFKPVEKFEIPIIDEISIEKKLSVDPKIIKVYKNLKNEYKQGKIKDSRITKLLLEIERLNFSINQKEEKIRLLSADKKTSQLISWLDDNILKKSDVSKIKDFLKKDLRKRDEHFLEIGRILFELYKENRVTHADLGELIIKTIKNYLEIV